MILDQIVRERRKDILRAKKERPLDQFILDLQPSDRDFRSICSPGSFGIIAEFKRRSPSEGPIGQSPDLAETVGLYDRIPHIKALSILTESRHFGGSAEDLRTARQLTAKPLLRKDFIIDEYQVYESRFFGADAILLIARILSPYQISAFARRARQMNMHVLCEIHDEQDLAKVPAGMDIIGINNRDLDSLQIDLGSTASLSAKLKKDYNPVPAVPAGHGKRSVPPLITVTESGIHKRSDLEKVRYHAQAALIGTGILKSGDPEQWFQDLFRPRVKICGITRVDDAQLAAELGADNLGFVMHRKSPRYIDAGEAELIIKQIRARFPDIVFSGVYADEPDDIVLSDLQLASFDYIQSFRDIPSLPRQKQIRTLRVDSDITPLPEHASEYRALLLDTGHPNLAGGTGQRFNWQLIRQLPSDIPYIVAGGIDSNNLTELLDLQVPYIDLSSSLESSPGKKDEDKMRSFFKALNSGQNKAENI